MFFPESMGSQSLFAFQCNPGVVMVIPLAGLLFSWRSLPSKKSRSGICGKTLLSFGPFWMQPAMACWPCTRMEPS
ncbi:MAG: hypothetical protein EA399_08620 [Desulfovibrionales bacterium]|nr:MAG: hypothetical protein EA399_08620 [Desulfovibrionales bacterium]